MDSTQLLKRDIVHLFNEDGISSNCFYDSKLPNDIVKCTLKFKSDLIISGLNYFIALFEHLSSNSFDRELLRYEGKNVKAKELFELSFELPFSVALTGERLALNLLQHASAIATHTDKFVGKADKYEIKILDTRKTTPGLRSLEKYAVRIGGGYNHRFSQQDMWMVKDNHKSFFGGVKESIDFFRSVGSFYTPIEVEVHNISELEEAISLNVQHIMLDNFSPDEVLQAVKLKPSGVTYEVSGGINLDNIDNYLLDGVDAISSSAITTGIPSVDIALKFRRK